ncbi:plasmid pRiA4b ORF-3 family protein, partial [Streptomyces sp. NPDC001292]|uniref:plasmid pRiA4b ORF-3 family protein n=1 Tax=Streptomyces sp. NPDC001292 TaxID=3364558 RepID=UPI0036BD931F
MANSRSAKTPQTAPSKTVHKIKITLRDSRPPIWRRLEVPSGITLRELHDVIQAAFGWEDYHMWAFETGRDRYGVADRDLGIRSAASKRLGQVAPRTGDRLRYTYDFGDDWEHDILIEDVTAPEAGTPYPRCLTGRRACPPEDCGGIWGYDYLIEILADPRHEEHEDRL